LDGLWRINQKAWELLAKFETQGDYRGAIVALREVRECIEATHAMLSQAGAGGPVEINVRVIALGPTPAGANPTCLIRTPFSSREHS
jgi:hypothetical protein